MLQLQKSAYYLSTQIQCISSSLGAGLANIIHGGQSGLRGDQKYHERMNLLLRQSEPDESSQKQSRCVATVYNTAREYADTVNKYKHIYYKTGICRNTKWNSKKWISV